MLNQEYSRLYKLWQENRLTDEEFKLLTANITYNTWFDKILTWIYNPFAKLNPKSALSIGLCLIVLTSFIGHITGFHYPGIPGAEEILPPNKKISFNYILVEQLIQLSILSLSFYLISKLTRVKNIRLFDFFAFFAMCFIAKAIFSILLIILKSISVNFFILSSNTNALLSIYSNLAIFIWMVIRYLIYIWVIRLYFIAYKLASGIQKVVTLWIIFTIGLIISSTICFNLLSYLNLHSMLFS